MVALFRLLAYLFYCLLLSDEMLPLIKLSRAGCPGDAWSGLAGRAGVMMTGCAESPRSPARPLRLISPSVRPSPDLWTPAANVPAGQAGAETINCPDRRCEGSVVAGPLTQAGTQWPGPRARVTAVNCHSDHGDNRCPEETSTVKPTSMFSKVGPFIYFQCLIQAAE